MGDQEDFSGLIPELKDWNDGKGIDVDSWIACIGAFEHAIGYSHLFWPEFVEHDGCILRRGFSEENYRGFMEHTAGDKGAVEAVMNHVHLLDLFLASERPTRAQILYLGRVLKEMWSAKLRSRFPDRTITVSFPEDDHDDLLDYEITVFQHEHAA